MVGGDFHVLQHALADGDARHDDDEFLEAVTLAESSKIVRR